MAVDAATGEVRWVQSSLLDESPKIPQAKGVRSFIGHQPPLVDSDTTFILNVSKDGPMRIDSRTGELLWRSDLDEDAPHLRDGYAPMLYVDGVLFAPYKKKMVALNTSDGSVIWDRRRDFRSRVTQMEFTAHGLVIRGRKPDDKDPSKPGKDFFVDLLDPETGTSIWEREYRDFKVNLPFIATDESIVVTKQEELIALDYADGSEALLAEFEFEGNDDPTRVQMSGGNILISANQNFLALTDDGTVKYQVYYEAPGRDWFQNAAMLLASTAMETGCLTLEHGGGSRLTPRIVFVGMESAVGSTLKLGVVFGTPRYEPIMPMYTRSSPMPQGVKDSAWCGSISGMGQRSDGCGSMSAGRTTSSTSQAVWCM